MPAIDFFKTPRFFAGKMRSKIKAKLKNVFVKEVIKDTIFNASLDSLDHIKCKWKLSSNDQKVIDHSRIFCLSIRIFDITQVSLNRRLTCIMKEIEVNKKIDEYSIPLPILDGKILLELGYRSSDGSWIALSSSLINLGVRKYSEFFIDDSWFFSKPTYSKQADLLHEEMFNLSKSVKSGGSEKIHISK